VLGSAFSGGLCFEEQLQQTVDPPLFYSTLSCFRRSLAPPPNRWEWAGRTCRKSASPHVAEHLCRLAGIVVLAQVLDEAPMSLW